MIKVNNFKQMQRKNPYFGHSNFSALTTILPTQDRNYCLFNQDRVNYVVSQKEQALPQLKLTLQNSQDEKEIVETLYIIDRMIDNGVKGIPAMYPYFAKFNNTKSSNIQSYLAGIYRKTQVPDAFGPLVSMLIENSLMVKQKKALCKSNDGGLGNPPYVANASENTALFDPNEEIGGAILEYIRNYSQGPKPIDYTA